MLLKHRRCSEQKCTDATPNDSCTETSFSELTSYLEMMNYVKPFFPLLLCQLLSSFTFVLSHSSIKVCQQLLDSYCEISTDSHGSDYNLSCNDFSLPHFSPRASSDFSNLSTRRVKLAVSVATREFPLG